MIDLLILDVDGVLTDGTVAPTAAEGEHRKGRGYLCPSDGKEDLRRTVCPPVRFHTQDGCAIKLWQRCGGTVAILSGRGAETVRLRAAELGVEKVLLNVSDKLAGYEEILATGRFDHERTGYIGDDLPDLGPMERCGFPVAVSNAVPAVKRASMYVTRRRGGCGAVAEVVELLLRKRKRWSAEVRRFEG